MTNNRIIVLYDIENKVKQIVRFVCIFVVTKQEMAVWLHIISHFESVDYFQSSTYTLLHKT